MHLKYFSDSINFSSHFLFPHRLYLLLFKFSSTVFYRTGTCYNLLIFLQAAYRDNTLGLTKMCPRENIPIIDQSLLYTFLKHHYDPSRMVLAGVGIDHDALVECAKRYV